MELNGLDGQIIQSTLLHTTINITAKSDFSRTNRTLDTKQNGELVTRGTLNVTEHESVLEPNINLGMSQRDRPVTIQLVNSSMQYLYGIGIHLKMSRCIITVNTHPPLSSMFVIENSTANITDCIFYGDSNPLALNMKRAFKV